MSRRTYSETVQVRVPEGFTSAILRAAERHCLDASAFVRMTLADRLREVGIAPPEASPRRRKAEA